MDEVGVDSASGKVRVKVNPEFYRPLDNQNLLGSADKAKKLLGWTPMYSFEALVEEMVLADVEAVNAGRIFSNSNLDWVVGDNRAGAGSPRGSPKSTTGNEVAKFADAGLKKKSETQGPNVGLDKESSEGTEKFSLVGAEVEG